MKVEIIKLGSILRGGVYEITPLIQIISKDETTLNEDIISFYLGQLKEYVGDRYLIMKTKGIVGSINFNPYVSIKGPFFIINDSLPQIGQKFKCNSGNWGTSIVEEIVSDDVFITKNSVYLIYDKSKFRERKLDDLGI